MAQIGFGEQACQKFRARLDSYIDNELLTEGNLEMIDHFRRCKSCARELQDRRDLARRLRDAVHDITVPTGLEQRVRDCLRQPKQPQPRKLFLMAIAAVLVLCFGILRFTDSTGRLPGLALDDHLHCAVIHQPESGEFFVYTVCDLPPRANAEILASLAPGLHAFLDQA